MNSSVTHPAARSDGSWLVRYADALRQLDGARMTECFTCNGSYRSFLVHVQLPPPPASPMRGYSYGRPPPRPPSDPELEGRIPASELAAFTSSLKRSLRASHVEIISQLLSSDGRTGAVEYVLSGEWSGRLSSMVVGVFDKPMRLRCIDVLHLQPSDESTDVHASERIAEADVRIDRLEFLIAIGMAKAQL